jgi:hypothetical protein
MNRLIATVGVLVLGGPARADMAPPWPINYRVPVRVTITTDPAPPGAELFVVANGGPRRLTAETPVVLESNGGLGFSAYAVEPWALKEFNGAVPPLDWFSPTHSAKYRLLGVESIRANLDYFDGRSAIVREYRVERQGEWVQLRKVSDNEGSRWWYTWPCCATSVAIPVGFLWLVGWMLGRVVSRRSEVSAGKQLPPPSTPGVTPT